MIVHNDIENLPQEASGCVLAIGNFDGLHLGHQMIINQAKQIADKAQAPLGVMTFEPNAKQFFSAQSDDFRLISPSAKEELLENMGVNHLFQINFDEEFSQVSAEYFINKILCEQMRVKHVLVGENFVFGYKRGGDIKLLKQAEAEGKITLTVMPIKKADDGVVYSSTVIRDLLRNADFSEAEKLLGRKWVIEAVVEHGDKRGRELGYPTANQYLKEYVKIPYGVYAVKVLIEGDGVWREGVANFGIRPMFEVETPVFETFIFDFSADIYGKKMRVMPVKYLRAEARFESVKVLVDKIKEDCFNAKAVLETV